MLIVATLVAPLPFYLLGSEKRKGFGYLSNICFVVGAALLLLTGYSVIPIIVEEIRIRDAVDTEWEVISMFTTVDSLKVRARDH